MATAQDSPVIENETEEETGDADEFVSQLPEPVNAHKMEDGTIIDLGDDAPTLDALRDVEYRLHEIKQELIIIHKSQIAPAEERLTQTTEAMQRARNKLWEIKNNSDYGNRASARAELAQQFESMAAKRASAITMVKAKAFYDGADKNPVDTWQKFQAWLDANGLGQLWQAAKRRYPTDLGCSTFVAQPLAGNYRSKCIVAFDPKGIPLFICGTGKYEYPRFLGESHGWESAMGHNSPAYGPAQRHALRKYVANEGGITWSPYNGARPRAAYNYAADYVYSLIVGQEIYNKEESDAE